jgi:DNA repair exonuclease SbcCD ATPase subunit
MKDIVNQLKAKRDILEKEYDNLTKEILDLRNRVELLRKVKNVFVKSVAVSNDNVKNVIESFVTDGISLVYSEGYRFCVEEVFTGGRVGYAFKISKDNHSRSLMCYGGGIRNIVSTLLRFVLAKYLPYKMPFILDEVGSNISKEYQSKFGYLLKVFSEKLGIQIILITHQSKIAEHADKIINVNFNEDKTVIL